MPRSQNNTYAFIHMILTCLIVNTIFSRIYLNVILATVLGVSRRCRVFCTSACWYKHIKIQKMLNMSHVF